MDGALKILADSLDLVIITAVLGIGYFRGRKNEREHLADLARREQELAEVLTFATRYPPIEATPLDPRLVSGSAVVAADAFKMFVAGLRKLVGGRFRAYETLVDRARREAMLRMKQDARDAGCAMIFNVRVETTRLMGGKQGGSTAVEVFAYGTAFAPAAGSVAESTLRYTPGPDLPAVEGFDLAKNPYTKWLLIAWVGLLVYGFAEMSGLSPYWYVDGAPWNVFFVAAFLFCIGAFRLLRKRKVPMAESVTLSLLVSVTLPLLLFFPALRFNAWTDFSPRAETVYRLEADGLLHASESGKPTLPMPNQRDYFAVQELGSEYRLVVRRGWLGVWQMEREPLASQIMAFHQAQVLKRQQGN